MDKKTYNRILKGCRKFAKAGGEIVRGYWGVEFDHWTGQWRPSQDNCGCALGGAMVAEKCTIKRVENNAAAKLFGLTKTQVEDFITGFDGEFGDDEIQNTYVEAGRRLYAQLAKEGILS